MLGRRVMVGVLALAAHLLTVGCNSSEEVTVVGRVHYFHPRGSVVCSEDAEYLNRSLDQLERYFGLRPFERSSP